MLETSSCSFAKAPENKPQRFLDHTWGVGSCFYPTNKIFTEKMMYNDGIPGDSIKLLVGDLHNLSYPDFQAKKPLVVG